MSQAVLARPFDLPVRVVPDRLATTVEQIVEGLTLAMLRGEFEAGARIGEQDVADRFGVSRGPVREALRALAGSGLVELSPRRGAFAMGISLDLVADLFNVRASLMALAARCFTRAGTAAGLAEMTDRLALLEALVPRGEAAAFATASARLGATLYRHSGNPYLINLLRDGAQTALWGLIWREQPLDFRTTARRKAMLHLWQNVAAAARSGNDAEAEQITRRILIESRDAALAALAKGQRAAAASRIIPA